jgi:DNA repair exonuclease SbcCD ATPase subunit
LAEGGRLKCALIDKASVLQAQYAAIKSRIEAFVAQAKALEAKRARVQGLKSSLEASSTELHLELDVAALVGKGGFLNVIFDDVLAEVAAATNEILSGIANVRHIVVSFDTDDPTRIVPMVSIDGVARPLRSYLSGGMQSAVKLALDLGLGAVVSKRRGKYPGFLVLDESFNGLGPVAQESCLEVLSAAAKDRLIFVIQHADRFVGLFDRVIHVKLIDGESFIS